MFSIRESLPGDVKAIARINADAWREAYRDIVTPDYLSRNFTVFMREKRFQEIIKQSGQQLYTCLLDQTVIGFYSIGEPRDEDMPADSRELIAMYFDPAYWRKGFGSLAMRDALNRTAGASAVYLWVLERNLPAVRFYERFGYRPDGKKQTLDLGKPAVVCRYIIEKQLAYIKNAMTSR